jgi:hypothetical protein
MAQSTVGVSIALVRLARLMELARVTQ